MMKKASVLLLALCLVASLFSLTVGAADEAKGVFGTNMHIFTFVSLIVLGVLLIAGVVFCIIKREFVMKSLRAYKSEMTKITWYSWKNVLRGTVFVVVTILVFAVVLGLLDIVFFEAQYLATGKGFSFFGG